jgi:M6 family metalloprotease-like protein
LLSSGIVDAAPFKTRISFTQPDGSVVKIDGRGDEFYAVFETLEGYTVVYDTALRAYCYARLSADGSELLSTGAPARDLIPAGIHLERHLRISSESIRNQSSRRHAKWETATGLPQRWQSLKAMAHAREDGPLASPPSHTTTGTRVGLTLLIDFDSDPGTIKQAEIVKFCNGTNYTGYGNNGSIKQYFWDVSNGKLLYSNLVTAYIRIPSSLHPKSWYNDVSKDCADQGNLLIRDAIEILKALPNYETQILPAFDALSVDGDNRVVACNVFYAGGNGDVWDKGLWPNSFSLYNVGAIELSPGGKKIWDYQISDIGTSLTIATFCHENGHMLCGFPDIYDYDYDSQGGAGDFCLMGSGLTDGNPSQICAYLKLAAGWATVTDLNVGFIDPPAGWGLETVTASAGAGFNHFFRYVNRNSPTEYFLIESRYRDGRDKNIPCSGVAVWHVDELGDRDNQSLIPNTVHANYEVTLVQADNRWDLENNRNSGDSQDLYFAGNSSAGYGNVLSDDTTPSSRWWSGKSSGLKLSGFAGVGAAGTSASPTMSFLVGSGFTNATYYDWSVAVGQPGGAGCMDGPGGAARFFNPAGVAIDSEGNCYVADSSNAVIRRVSPAGVATTIAGRIGSPAYCDGSGDSARFLRPSRLVLDGRGNLLVADSTRIRLVTAAGLVTTFVDTSWNEVPFSDPDGMALSPAGDLFVSDTGNHAIWKISTSGVVSLFAGTPGFSGSVDGVVGAALFDTPRGLALDADGNLYVADCGNDVIRKIDATGTTTTLAGLIGLAGYLDGVATMARFTGPADIAMGLSGDLYVADAGNHLIRRVTLQGAVTTIAGQVGRSGVTDGVGEAALFNGPTGIALAPRGNLVIADTQNNLIRRIGLDGMVVTLAGAPRHSGLVNGDSSLAKFSSPRGITIDSTRMIYVADSANNSVRKVSAAYNYVSAFAGSSSGQAGVNDGTSTAAKLTCPSGAAVSLQRNVYVADTGNHTIRRITTNAIVKTLAGSAGVRGSSDGIGGAARFNSPSGIAVDSVSNIYVADTLNHTIRMLTRETNVTTLAGTAVVVGWRDGACGQALLSSPVGLAMDGTGNLLIADQGNHVIRKLNIAAQTIATIAGIPGMAGDADGLAGAAQFSSPGGVAVDGAGNVFVADTGNHRIRMISPQGWVATIGGAAGSWGTVEGFGADARFGRPWGIIVDPARNIYVTDFDNNCIFKGAPVYVPVPVSPFPERIIGLAGQPVTLSVGVGGPGPVWCQWLLDGVAIAGATSSTYTIASADASSAGAYTVMLSNHVGTATAGSATTLEIWDSPAAVLTLDSNVDYGVSLSLEGITGRDYLIEASEDLVNWEPVWTSAAPFIYVDAGAGVPPARFYRAVYRP